MADAHIASQEAIASMPVDDVGTPWRQWIAAAASGSASRLAFVRAL
jgi:hypothetical protein